MAMNAASNEVIEVGLDMEIESCMVLSSSAKVSSLGHSNVFDGLSSSQGPAVQNASPTPAATSISSNVPRPNWTRYPRHRDRGMRTGFNRPPPPRPLVLPSQQPLPPPLQPRVSPSFSVHSCPVPSHCIDRRPSLSNNWGMRPHGPPENYNYNYNNVVVGPCSFVPPPSSHVPLNVPGLYRMPVTSHGCSYSSMQSLKDLSSFIVFQINYYFSDQNLETDYYLRSLMDDQGWVSVHLIADFRRIKHSTDNIPLILDSMRSSTIVEVQGDKLRKRHGWERYINRRDREE